MRTSPLHSAHQTPWFPDAVTRILIIDDDASVSTAIHAILLQHQCETVIASRAHAGIHKFRNGTFDAVMIDLFMPGMNGLDTIARIRSESAVSIIAMSGFPLRNSRDPDQDYLGMAKRCGATTSLRKPFSPLQLFAAIDRSLARNSLKEEAVQ
jgi:two-component system response regulator (stage 0 sporulation protein F)